MAGPDGARLRGGDPRLPLDPGLLQPATEAVNLLTRKVKRVGHGFRSLASYHLRLLLDCGVTWQTPDGEIARSLTTFGGAEPVYDFRCASKKATMRRRASWADGSW